MTDHRILRRQRQDALEGIEAHVASIAEVRPDLGEKAEAVANARGRDAAHTETARTVALAEFMEALDVELRGDDAGDPLENKTVPVLRQMADELGLELDSKAKKADIIEAINALEAEREMWEERRRAHEDRTVDELQGEADALGVEYTSDTLKAALVDSIMEAERAGYYGDEVESAGDANDRESTDEGADDAGQ